MIEVQVARLLKADLGPMLTPIVLLLQKILLNVNVKRSTGFFVRWACGLQISDFFPFLPHR